MMNSYQVLDIPRALSHFFDEENTRMMIDAFAEAMTFKQLVENHHREIMAMKLIGSCDFIYGVFHYFTSFEMRRLINEINPLSANKNFVRGGFEFYFPLHF